MTAALTAVASLFTCVAAGLCIRTAIDAPDTPQGIALALIGTVLGVLGVFMAVVAEEEFRK